MPGTGPDLTARSHTRPSHITVIDVQSLGWSHAGYLTGGGSAAGGGSGVWRLDSQVKTKTRKTQKSLEPLCRSV